MENNKVLVVGGEQCFPASFGGTGGFECTALNTAEIYDPTTETFTPAGSGSCGTMTTARAGATATLINHTNYYTYLDGRILIVGGTSGSSFQSATPPPPPGSGAPTGQVAQNTAEIYDPVSDTFSPVAATVPVPSTCGASGTSPCGLVNHAAALVGGGDETPRQGQVLIAGGDLVSPLYESTKLAFIFDAGPRDLHRCGPDEYAPRAVQPDACQPAVRVPRRHHHRAGSGWCQRSVDVLHHGRRYARHDQ